jgi:hypothetical protein
MRSHPCRTAECVRVRSAGIAYEIAVFSEPNIFSLSEGSAVRGFKKEHIILTISDAGATIGSSVMSRLRLFGR